MNYPRHLRILLPPINLGNYPEQPYYYSPYHYGILDLLAPAC